ncbi:MAG: DNA-3-methyladenine glycosylase 2 family protein [Bacteroidia bacterium]|nr:DNA-3-methyladenine glycosylase 2 family protein [Bacteroidia bacterium]NNK90102.1 DNA-3-methyladenine glycosylase 2 family protein [Saprospiraceae bacterium]
MLKLPKSGNVFNELVKAIVYQQISYKAADSIYSRFIELFDSEKYMPAELSKQKFEDLRSAGLSNQKANYVKNIALFFEEHQLINCDWERLSDEEIIDLLTRIKGVGTWTVHMILIFQLCRPDVFPDKDLAIQIVMKKLYRINSEKRQLLVDMNKIAHNWSPYRSFASLYLWSWRRDNN